MAKNFNIEGSRLAGYMTDPQRQIFKFVIPDASVIAPNLNLDVDDLIVKTRRASIPGMGVEVFQSNYMMMQQLFVSKPTLETSMNLTFEEFEDQTVEVFFRTWLNSICNISATPEASATSPVNTNLAGVSYYKSKRSGLVRPCYLLLYGFDGRLLDYKYKLVNAFPEKIDPVDLEYGATDSVKLNVTMRFDYPELVKNN